MFDRVLTCILVSAFVATFCAYTGVSRAQVVKDGLVSYWTFDEDDIDGKMLKDVLGDNDGTISGDPKVIDGKISKALAFDGSNHIVFGNDPSVLLSDTDLSVMIWFNADTVGPGLDDNTGYLVGTYSSGNGKYYQLFVENGTIAWSIDDNVTKTQINSPINAGEWYHAVGVRESGKKIKLYLNGELALDADDQTTADITSDAPLYAGNRFAGSRAFKGLIDDIGIYNRALTEAETLQNYGAEGLAVELAGKLTITWGKIKALQ